LIIAVSAAYLIRRALMVDTIYTFKLTRRGQRVPSSLQSQLYLARGALEFVHAPFTLAPAGGTLSDLSISRDRRSTHVVLESDDGSVAGVIAAPDLTEVRRRATGDMPLADLAQPRQVVAPVDAQILDVMALLRNGGATIAIFTEDGEPAPARAVKGILTWQNVVDATNLAAPTSRVEERRSTEVLNVPAR
jgi:CIC family chloride channel protein